MTLKSKLGGRLALLALALVLAGCSNEETEKLYGRWEGHAEGAANSAALEEGEPEGDSAGGGHSLLSRFDFSIALDFAKDGTVQMSVAGGEETLPQGNQSSEAQSIKGEWTVVEAEKNRLTVEIETPPVLDSSVSDGGPTGEGEDSKATPVSQTADSNAQAETRRFILRWTEGDPDRFTLTEEDGEPHLGALIFRRVESPKAPVE